MPEDTRLLKIEVGGGTRASSWGNYASEYNWSWTPDGPLITPLNNIRMAGGVLIRDHTVARKLKELGIKKVLDIGSDTGHFMAVLSYYGIEAVGIDTEKMCCDYIKQKGVNTCYNIGIEDLIKLSSLQGYDCISCMNITHAKWKNESLKKEFINWVSNNTSYAILSDFTNQDKEWKGLVMLHDFNFLPFRYSPLLERIFRKLSLEKIVSYSCLQKIYKVV